jgi:hypothetical protein
MSTLTQFLGADAPTVQRGTTSAAGTITISAVNVASSTVISVSKSSAGTVATSGSVSLSPQFNVSSGEGIQGTSSTGAGNVFLAPFPSYAGTLAGGTTSLTCGVYSATLTSPTTLVCDGPVQWQVVSYN